MGWGGAWACPWRSVRSGPYVHLGQIACAVESRSSHFTWGGTVSWPRRVLRRRPYQAPVLARCYSSHRWEVRLGRSPRISCVPWKCNSSPTACTSRALPGPAKVNLRRTSVRRGHLRLCKGIGGSQRRPSSCTCPRQICVCRGNALFVPWSARCFRSMPNKTRQCDQFRCPADSWRGPRPWKWRCGWPLTRSSITRAHEAFG